MHILIGFPLGGGPSDNAWDHKNYNYWSLTLKWRKEMKKNKKCCATWSRSSACTAGWLRMWKWKWNWRLAHFIRASPPWWCDYLVSCARLRCHPTPFFLSQGATSNTKKSLPFVQSTWCVCNCTSMLFVDEISWRLSWCYSLFQEYIQLTIYMLI